MNYVTRIQAYFTSAGISEKIMFSRIELKRDGNSVFPIPVLHYFYYGTKTPWPENAYAWSFAQHCYIGLKVDTKSTDPHCPSQLCEEVTITWGPEDSGVILFLTKVICWGTTVGFQELESGYQSLHTDYENLKMASIIK